MSTLTSLPQWQALNQIAASMKDAHMRDWFKADPKRAEKNAVRSVRHFS